MRLIKKLLSLLASAFAVMVISGFLSLHAVSDTGTRNLATTVFAQVENGNGCVDITMTDGKTETKTAVPEGAIANSGQINFGSPIQSAQTCVETDPIPSVEDIIDPAKKFKMDGWAWNNNLGDMSFSCAAGKNLGIDCGNVNYKTVLQGSDGKMRGFAYGENTGWVSMGCDAGSNMGVNCGVVNYGVNVSLITQGPQQGCARDDGKLHKGDLYGYAWSDTVGWVNFCGASVDPKLLPNFPWPLDVTPIVNYLPSQLTPYADGNDYYYIAVNLWDNGTNDWMTDIPPGHSVSITGLGWTNTVRTNQVDPCKPLDPAAQSACVYNGATKPSKANFVWNNPVPELGGIPGYYAKVSAIAPTGPLDAIVLKDIEIKVDGLPDVMLEPRHSFDFAAPVQVTNIHTQESPPDAIQLVSGAYQPLLITAQNYGQPAAMPTNDLIDVYSQLYNCSPDYNLVFANDDLTVPVYPNVNPKLINSKFPYYDPDNLCGGNGDGLIDLTKNSLDQFNDNNSLTKLVWTDPSNPANTNPESLGAVGVKTIIDYLYNNITQVRYYSKTVNDGSVLNQNADVRGNVNINVQERTALSSNKISQSVGENAQSKRELYYRAVKALLGSKQPQLITEKSYALSDLNRAAPILYVARNPTMNGSYENGSIFPCSVIIKEDDIFSRVGQPKDLMKKMTIVSQGCDVFIDRNIMLKEDVGELGIIALADLSRTNTRKGGNVYICTKVTDLNGVHIVADGSVFTYGKTDTYCGGNSKLTAVQNADNPGLPVPPEIPLREAFKNQFSMQGSLTSNNTYGGSIKTPPVMGDGSLVKDPKQIDIARFYDLNFLRYAHVTKKDFGFGEMSCWADGTKLSQSLIDPANIRLEGTSEEICSDDNNNPISRGIVNISYRMPSGDLPIFNVVAGK